MTGTFIKELMKKAFTGGAKKTTGTGVIKNVPLSPNLTTKRNIQDAVVKAVDEGTKKGLGGATPSQKLKQSMSESKVKKSRELKDYSYTADKYKKKAKGGRVGLKRGTGLMKKKSNVEKIKETFAPRVSKNKKASKFGMLSVKAGIDKNPNPTQADRIAGAKIKSKKRFV